MNKKIYSVITGISTYDGAGVKLTRLIGQPNLNTLDPFLLLDAFRSDDPNDYIAGFPSHPHRGFETVTYMLNGKMRHKDNKGNEGVIEAGGVQWMTAAKGIIHSEIPEQEDGLLEGFQLWINLPATHKMDSPSYQEYNKENIPIEKRPGTKIKVITGITSKGTKGPVIQTLTEPVYLDISLNKGFEFIETLPIDNNSFIYVISGEINILNSDHKLITITKDQLGLLGDGTQVSIESNTGCQFLLISGKPINEPIARGGPFVMNTKAEILQAFKDYETGDF